MDTSKLEECRGYTVSELIDIESEDFASRVCDVVMGGNASSKSAMFVIIDELVSDMIAQAHTADQLKMLSVVQNASKALRGVMLDQKEEE